MLEGYEPLKSLLLDTVQLPKDAIHIYIGFGCLIVSVLVLRLPFDSWRALALGLVVSLGIEGLDLASTVGYPAWIRWGGAARDILNTNFLPLAIVATAKRVARRQPKD